MQILKRPYRVWLYGYVLILGGQAECGQESVAYDGIMGIYVVHIRLKCLDMIYGILVLIVRIEFTIIRMCHSLLGEREVYNNVRGV